MGAARSVVAPGVAVDGVGDAGSDRRHLGGRDGDARHVIGRHLRLPGNCVRPLCHDDGMSTNTQNGQTPTQLALLEDLGLPLQFRLDQRTRERGLAHIAAIKAQLDARAEDRSEAPSAPARRRAA